MKRAVVKLGGSTALDAEMDVWISALAGSELPLVIVPGGGPFADQVRQSQQRMGFSDKAAHAMAILAMDQFGHVILDCDGRLTAAHTRQDIEAALLDGKIPVWLPSAWAIPVPDIQASWDITSDSLAAWLAGEIDAKALLLIKQSSNFSGHDDIAGLTKRGILDAGFASMLAAGIDLHLASPVDAAGAGALLTSSRLPGTKVQLAASPARKAG